MLTQPRAACLVAAILLSTVSALRAEQPPTAKTLFAFDKQFDLAAATASDAEVSLVEADGQTRLRVATGHRAPWPGITLAPQGGPWDLSSFAEITVAVTNAGSSEATVNCRVDSPGGDGAKNSVSKHVTLGPGQSGTIAVPLTPGLPSALAEKLYGMRGYPGGLRKESGLDPSRITQIILFVGRPKQDHVFEIGAIRASGECHTLAWTRMTPEEFFPMIDRYGQFIHKDWPGKTHSDDDLKRHGEAEQADLAAHPVPDDWDQYGGWKAGPQLEATGRFRTEKHRGKWWLVDPEGRLFWSHGADCVRSSSGVTPITDREFYFAELPDDAASASFYGKAWWAPHGYYQDRGAYRTFNFTAANLLRKYGPEWRDRFADICHRRLRSWSMNTIANWSDESIYQLRRTPYVVSISAGDRKAIEGSTGYWGKFPDPFDPSFAKQLRKRMAHEKDTSAGDPWCIGYFVDNELAWGNDPSLAVAALASPPDQPAKQAFLKQLKEKYGTIEKLNKAWGTEHASWEALAESQTPPDGKKAGDDLGDFYTAIAREYFRRSREAVKEVAPQALYLGCRFAWTNDRAIVASADYCDVIGLNKYRNDLADFRLPEGIDKPAIIGEFHFGALDRGMFHTGLRPTENQAARAEAYRRYVRTALENPWLVGTHWFQYADQATTGRGDGENYQIGLVDICDTPYPETIAALRDVGGSMYRTRLGSSPQKTAEE